MGNGPASNRMRDGDDVVAPQLGLGVAGPVHAVGEVCIGVHEQQGQQLVAAGHVPIHSRGHHAQVARYRAQGQPGRPVLDQLTPPKAHNFRLELFPGVLALAHTASVAHPRSLLLYLAQGCGTLDLVRAVLSVA